MFEANVFQEFQPIGGVSAKPSNFWAKAVAVRHRVANRRVLLLGAWVGQKQSGTGPGGSNFLTE
jgi:hypothetical protein